MKLKKPNINLTNSNYHERYMVMFDLVRFGTTKEVTDHIMFQREIIESQKATVVVLQACLDSGFTDVELVAKHPESGRRIEYDVASVEYSMPTFYIHADYEQGSE